jgi:hypothetical protein
MFLMTLLASTILLSAIDYGLFLGLVLLFTLFGILLVCVPRPRKKLDQASEPRGGA